MLIRLLVLSFIFGLCSSISAGAQPSAPAQDDAAGGEYVLGPADVVHVTVFENPELTSDVRVSERGTITFPLVGSVRLLGLTIPQAEAALATKLRDGHFVANPQVSILPVVVRGSQITVVGYVNKPGRYPLETVNTHVSDALAAAGGISPNGADSIILIRHTGGRETRTPLDVDELFVRGSEEDAQVESGDTLYIPREPYFYVYGEVDKPGAFRLERHMTLMQALAVGGFAADKGSKSRTQVYRQSSDGALKQIDVGLTDMLEANDVIYVRIRIF